MRLLPIELVAVWAIFFSHWASASEIRVLGNDTGLQFAGGWGFSSGRCAGEEAATTTRRGDTVSFIFKGTGVSVSLLQIFDGSLANIYLDGASLSGDIDLVDSTARDYQCKRKMVNSTVLPNVDHNVTILHAGKSPNSVSTNADWLGLINIVYTTPDVASSSDESTSTHSTPTSTSSNNVKTSALIGGTVGGILGGIILGLAMAWCFVRKRYRKNRPESPILDVSHEATTTQLLTPYYTPPPVTYSDATEGTPWNPYHSHDGTATARDMPSSDDRPTSRHLQPVLNSTYAEGRPSSRKQGSARITSPPPPQYDFRGPD